MWVDTQQFQHVGSEFAEAYAQDTGTCSSPEDKEKCAQSSQRQGSAPVLTPYTGFFFLTYPTPDPTSRLLPPSPPPAFHEDACAVVVRSGAERERERERERESGRKGGRERDY